MPPTSAPRIAKSTKHGHHEALQLIAVAREHGKRKAWSRSASQDTGERNAGPTRAQECASSGCRRAPRPRGCWPPRAPPYQSGCDAGTNRASRRSRPRAPQRRCGLPGKCSGPDADTGHRSLDRALNSAVPPHGGADTDQHGDLRLKRKLSAAAGRPYGGRRPSRAPRRQESRRPGPAATPHRAARPARHQQKQSEHAGDDHGAMGQVDDIHDAPDQREAHGGEAVDQPHQHAVDDRSENAEHAES